MTTNLGRRMITVFKQIKSGFYILFKNDKMISLFLSSRTTKKKEQQMTEKEMNAWEINLLVKWMLCKHKEQGSILSTH